MSSIAYYSALSRALGTIHIGATLAAMCDDGRLFGVTNLQAVIYYKKYRNDWWVYKGTFLFVTWYFFETGSFVTERSTFAFFATLALSDFVIAIWMCYYLYQSKAAASFSTMASMLLGLMRLILVSGLATSACSLLVLITYAAARDAMFYLAIDFILPKLYINSFLAMLNRRQENQANKSPTQYEGHLNPPVVRITQTTENSIEETNINIPLKEMQHVHSSDELDQSKRVLVKFNRPADNV
ncbi:uncharacterized protein ARMOST_02988 [Armillaria ostoyae]|uniref:DUF6534 domain-containing protein n=1 Tax=Armillaria ostoyae TaxID=47428 RepID=A0A284QT94_ARMOS|nr:uncharacterized protein ARMOST_02988 [Armillaria ostoyae]